MKLIKCDLERLQNAHINMVYTTNPVTRSTWRTIYLRLYWEQYCIGL